jgi:hypothetical protein
MADINQQTDELARIMEQVNREMAYYGQITKTTADQKLDAEVQASTGMKNFTKASGTAADAVGHLASAGMAAGKAMLDGKKGAAAFNESIDGLSKAATAAGVALTLLIPGGALIKGIVAGFTALTAATAGMVKASNEMADKIYKGYSGLAKSGAAASDGMTGVYNDAKKLGLSMNDLDSFVGLVGENAKDLALFSGSVFEGRKQFADIGQAMEPYRKSLIAAGMTQEQINEGTMQYIRLQTRVGLAQNKTTQELADGAKKYLQEQDALTKLTGQSRQEQESAMEEARSQMRFRAKLEEMRGSGDEKQIAAAAQLEKTYVLLRSQSKEAAQGFGDMTTGMIGTEASQKLLMSTNGEALQTANQMVAGQKSAIEGTQAIAAAAGKTTKDMNMLYQTGAAEGFLLSIDEGAKLGLLAQKDLSEQYKKIEEDQKKQGQAGGKAADGITDQYAANIVQQQKLNEKFEKTVFDGIDNALKITNRLGNATDTLATGFEVLGKAVNKLLRIVGLGVKDEPTEAEKKAAVVMQGAQGTVDQAKAEKDKAFEGATFKQRVLGIGLTDEQKKAQDAYTEALRQRAEIQESIATDEAVTSKAAPPPPAAGKQALPAGVAPSTAGGGRGSVAPPSGGPPAAGGATTRSMAPAGGSPPPPSAGSPDGQPGKTTPAAGGGEGKGSLKIGPNADMSGVIPEMVSKLQKFAESTGKSVDVNSAYRSDQKQAELWVRGHILNEPGVHMPAAPKEDQEVNYKGKTFQVKGSGKGSLHGVGNAVDISVAGMGKSKGPIDELLANAGLFRPFIAKDPPHVQMMAEGGVVEPTPGGTPAIIGEGGNAEAVIPLKNGAVPVRLFGDSLKSDSESAPAMLDTESLFQNMTASIKSTLDIDSLFQNITASMKNADPGTMDTESLFQNMNSTMFAAVETLKADAIDSGFDRDMRQEVMEPEENVSETLTEMPASLETREPTGLMDMLKETKEQNFALLAMVSELVREQRNANDISTRILQVSSN